jgi:hypothetical protein
MSTTGLSVTEHFRSEVAKGAEGWGAKALHHVDRIPGTAAGVRGG